MMSIAASSVERNGLSRSYCWVKIIDESSRERGRTDNQERYRRRLPGGIPPEEMYGSRDPGPRSLEGSPYRNAQRIRADLPAASHREARVRQLPLWHVRPH